MNTDRHILPLALAVSLAVHAAAFLYLPTPRVPAARQPGDAGLQITLTRVSDNASSNMTAPPPVLQAPAARPARSTGRHTRTGPVSRHVPVNTHVTEATDTSPTAREVATDTAGETRIAPGQVLVAQLRDAIQPYFHYPLLARRRGWEGTVQVGLRISARGEISRLRIVKSSHHDILDRAALDSLGRVRSMPGAIAWLDGHDSDIVLPVEYRLTDG